MIFLYNVFLFLLLIIASPIIIFKLLTNERFGYRVKDRFIPSYKICKENYMLFHASSFGEVKTILNVVQKFEQSLEKTSIFSVFTDTGYELVKNKEGFIMPVDFYPIYKRIFCKTPDLALFFETEIWPSYIYFLKKNGVRLALINARMSDKSFKLYKIFSFLFKKTIKQFDIIIAKSEDDAKRFKFFNKNVVTCGNIKQIKHPKIVSEKEKKSILKKFSIDTKKPIFTFGSVHKEEIDFISEAVSKLKNDFFIIVAPRHKEDANLFYNAIKGLLRITERSSRLAAKEALLLDTIGELEEIYKISDIVFIGGSTNKTLKGHNPIEPLVYNKFIISGRYMESFKSEADSLVKMGLLKRITNISELTRISVDYIQNRTNIDSNHYFNNISHISDCYINWLKKYKK